MAFSHSVPFCPITACVKCVNLSASNCVHRITVLPIEKQLCGSKYIYLSGVAIPCQRMNTLTLTWLLPLFLNSHFSSTSRLNASTSSLLMASRFWIISLSRSRYPRAMDFMFCLVIAAASQTRCLLTNLSLRFDAIFQCYFCTYIMVDIIKCCIV